MTKLSRLCPGIPTAWLISLILIFPALARGNSPVPQYHPGRIIIRAHAGTDITLASLLGSVPLTQAKAYSDFSLKSILPDSKNADSRSMNLRADNPLNNLYVLSFPDTVNVLELISQLAGHPDVKYAEPDLRLDFFGWPNDSLFTQQWYLHNTGQEFYAIERNSGNNNDVLYLESGLPGEDINLGAVYDNPPADTVPVLVAVVDTGIDYDHPDLADHIFVNPLDPPGNEIDDDHNGYVDDYRGWDFSGDSSTLLYFETDNDATDSTGHGTHVAGLVAAVENEIGIAGFPGQIQIMPLKIFPNSYLSVALNAVSYAIEQGARVINASWGMPYSSPSMEEIIQFAANHNVLVVAAAGNYGISDPIYPAGYEGAYAVGATNADGEVTYFSNFGSYVEIFAPGRNILSLRAAGTDMYAATEPGLRIIAEQYYLADGTSMASPLVAGAAALLLNYNPGLTHQQLRDILNQTADDIIDPFGDGSNLTGYDTISGWGRLNVGNAVSQILQPAAYFTVPQDYDYVLDSVVFGVSITGGYAGAVDLYIGEGLEPDDWTLLFSSSGIETTDSFFVWQTNGRSGYFTFKITTDYGQDQLTLRIISGEAAAISYPVNDELLSHYVEISGSAYGADYDSLQIWTRPELSPSATLLFSSTRFYFDEFFSEWPLTSLDGGFYYITLVAFMGENTVEDSVRVEVKSLLREGFPADIGDFLAFSPTVGDITGDGIKEIIVGARNGLYVFDAQGQLLDGFPVETDRDMRSMPAIDDIDGDGISDIVAAGRDILACYNYQGQYLPGWPKAASTGMTYFSYPVPTVTELHDTEDSVVLYMTRYGEVHAYQYDGDPYFYSLEGLFTALDPNIFDTAQFAGVWVPFVTGIDIDNNGVNEVGAIYSTTDDPSGFYLWDGRNGLPPFDLPSPLTIETDLTNGGMISDVDRDGTYDVIMAGIATDRLSYLWVASQGIDPLPGWPVHLAGVEEWIGTAPICVDIDNDGDREILVAYSGYDIAWVFAFNDDGTPYMENPSMPSGVLFTVNSMLGNLIVADIDGDGTPNIIARGGFLFPGTGYERIFAWEPGGSMTPGYPIVTAASPSMVGSLPMTPVVDDLEGDGFSELILCSGSNDLVIWNLEAPYDTTMIMWPKYLGNVKNTGIDPRLGLPTGVDDPYDPSLPFSFEISRVYPNPFNPATAIEFSLDREREIKLEIFNILGQKVRALETGRLSAGKFSIIWDGCNDDGGQVASGVYLARLSDREGFSDIRKMVMLK